MANLIEPTDRGLYCAAGDFYIDPWQPVPRAVITHAHGDHARFGSQVYLTAKPGERILQRRMGAAAKIETLAYGEPTDRQGVKVSFHPAGHLLGSAQVRLEKGGEVWVVTGDYKTRPDSTCAPFELVRCNIFVTESTFGLPIYHWPPQAAVFSEINAWWRANQVLGRTSVLFAYALGKAQRVLAGLDPSIGPILTHGAVAAVNALYRAEGIVLPDELPADPANVKAAAGRAIVIAPPSARGSPWLRKFQPFSLAFASGWMQIRGARRRRALDRGFILSDHADWDELLDTIRATGASRVGVMHGYTHSLARYLQEKGTDAWEIATRYEDEEGQEEAAAAPSEEAAG
jgi:putative mRNA 3-end processing factor